MARAFDEAESLGSILGTEHILYGLVCDGIECTTRAFKYTKVNAASSRNLDSGQIAFVRSNVSN